MSNDHTNPQTEVDKTARPVEDPVEGIGDLWKQQDERLKPPMKFISAPWLILKAVLGIVILTTIYLLYSLQELPFTLFGSILGLFIFAAGPFFIGFALGLSFMSAKKVLAYTIVIGLISIFFMLYIFFIPYSSDIWVFGPNHTQYMWWYVILSFINMISFLPIGAAVAAATNAHD